MIVMNDIIKVNYIMISDCQSPFKNHYCFQIGSFPLLLSNFRKLVTYMYVSFFEFFSAISFAKKIENLGEFFFINIYVI